MQITSGKKSAIFWGISMARADIDGRKRLGTVWRFNSGMAFRKLLVDIVAVQMILLTPSFMQHTCSTIPELSLIRFIENAFIPGDGRVSQLRFQHCSQRFYANTVETRGKRN